MKRIVMSLLMLLSLSACDAVKERIGIQDPAKAEAEAKAIGAACRLSGRGLEDCYSLNESYPRASIYAGWKEMNEYMADRKMAEEPPKLDADGKPLDQGADSRTAMGLAKDGGKEAVKEPSKEVGKEPGKDAKAENGSKVEAGKDAVKDIRPKKPDLAKEVSKH